MKPLAIQPSPAVQRKPYSTLPLEPHIDLFLDANEGPTPPLDLLRVLEDVSRLRRYPSTDDLRALLASRLSVSTERLTVTAGGDDAIDRACRSVLAPGREIILTPPTFEMFPRYAALTGATAVNIPWASDPFPTQAVLAAITERTAAIALVTPNNPTGLTIPASDVRAIALAAPHALIILDLAYIEFADPQAQKDLEALALELPNILAIRTLSKAWGLAGLRIGYAVGDPRVINWIRAAGGPYAVSAPSAAIACRALETCEHLMRDYVANVRTERDQLFALLTDLGLDPWPSQANFVTTGARYDVHASPYASLRRQGIAAREWNNRTDLPSYACRITCPGNPAKFARLCRALRQYATEERAR
jgi:histidinol-phosphate aminotransferase